MLPFPHQSKSAKIYEHQYSFQYHINVVFFEQRQILIYLPQFSKIILSMGSANESRCYIVTPPLIGWAHIHHDLWVMCAAENYYFT